MHMPFALAPLSIDYVTLIIEGMGYGRSKLQAPFQILGRFWHGYTYFSVRYLVPEPHKPEIDAYTERKRAFVAESDAYWAETALPELRASRDWFRTLPVESMAPDALVTAWMDGWERAARAWGIHFHAIRGAYQITDDLSDFYESVVPDASPGQALRLVQARADVLHDVELWLDRLTSTVAADASLRGVFARHEPPTVGDLEGLPQAKAFLAELRAFLGEHGHLGGLFDDIAFPSWFEEPSMVLGDISRRLARSGGAPTDERRAALLSDSDEEANRIKALLANRPDDLARFEGLLEAGRRVGPLTEVHNYWIDRLVQSLVRSFAMRVGARLVKAGVIQAADDVLYLRRDEVPALLLDPVDQGALIAERRAAHDRQKTMRPPATVGKPKSSTETDRFDGARFEATEDGTMRGTGASAGIVRGTARVVLGPQDFDKVQPGDVIVAPSSNPSWVPLFTIAGGVLCNTGGVLCHAAVVAREVGLPAVVGLGDATTRIPDGAEVELDGTTGLVRVL